MQVENNLDRQPSTLYSFLSTNYTSGGTALPIKNTNGYYANWTVQLGRTGEEQAEILNLDSVGGTVLNTLGTTRFNHSQDTPVYQIHYDKVIFLRSTAGTAGTASAIATVSITPDSLYTTYDDTLGAATYAYQTQYYNSVSGDVSGTSPWFVPGGPSWYSLQRLRQRSKEALVSANYIKNDSTIDDWINEWVEQMSNAALKTNESYSVGTVAYAFGTAGYGTITAPLFKYANKVEITYDGITYTNSTKINTFEYSSSDFFSPIYPRHTWEGDTIFRILPTGSLGTARMTLSQIFTPLTYDSDELPQYLKSYTTYCIEYVLYRAKNLDQKDQAADKHYQKFLKGRGDFLSEITPRDQTGPQLIQFTDGFTGREEAIDYAGDYFV